MNGYLPAGKLPATLLAQLLHTIPTEDPALILGPAVGEDAAVIDFALEPNEVLVAKSDPITFATDEIGYYAVNVCANDLGVTGAVPRFYLPTILLPADHTDAALAERIFAQIGLACRAFGITVAGGHSEITHTVSQPIVAGTLLGVAVREQIVHSGGARPGDLVLLAGSIPVEGVSIIARERRAELLAAGWSVAQVNEAAAYLHQPGISVLAPALAAARAGLVTAMHDPTEGGIITGLREIAAAAEVGLTVDLSAIPITTLAAQLCAACGLDPLGVIASGALLATAAPDQVNTLQRYWDDLGWPSMIIGEVTGREKGLVAHSGGRLVEFPQFAVDEITKLWRT